MSIGLLQMTSQVEESGEGYYRKKNNKTPQQLKGSNKMQITTKATVFNADSFHSNKTNQDYHRMGLLLEGAATNFFVSDKVWAEVVKQPWFNSVCVSHEPTNVEVDLGNPSSMKRAQKSI